MGTKNKQDDSLTPEKTENISRRSFVKTVGRGSAVATSAGG
jgi:hypothetical protein